MKVTTLLYKVFLLCTISSFSQQKIIDSLSIELKNHADKNTSRLDILNDLCYYYSLVNPNKGIEVCEDAILLAKHLNNNKKLANAYKYKAMNHAVISQDSLAILLYDKTIEIQTSLKDELGIAKTTYNKGLIYFKQSNYIKANQSNWYAYTIFEKEQDSFLMAKMLNSIGINQMNLSLYPEALETYLKASKIYDNLNTSNNIEHASIIANIGLLYDRLKKHDLAIESYNKALVVFKKIGFQTGIANCLSNLGNAYDYKKIPEKSIKYYKEAHEIMSAIGDKTGIANNLTNLGIAYISLKNYSKAITYLENTKSIYKEIGNINNLSIVYNNIGLCYLNQVKSTTLKSNDYLLAKINFEKAYDSAKKVGDLKSQSNALNNLAEVNTKLENYKSAYQTKLLSVKIRDSFFSSEKKEEITKLQAQYLYEKKEAILSANHDKEQAISKAEIKQQKLIKNTTIIGGVCFILASILGFILYKRKRDAIQKVKEADFNTQVVEAELKALRVQMNPHFIFNSLNSIGDYILKNDTETASDYLTKFAKLMRQTLINSEKKEILLSEDIILINNYLEIENKRFNQQFTCKIDLDKNINPENTLVPPMIVQPFLENSIKHGLSPQKEKGHILITIKKENNMIVWSVDDNGIGLNNSNENKIKKHKQSFGMSITKNRIDIINKQKNTNGNVKVIEKNKGVRVEISLPLELAF